ncbi:PDZ domain-containing protein [Natronospora cellulosivora (SeqCode)]
MDFESIMVNTSKQGLIGNSFLENFKVVINYLSEELILIGDKDSVLVEGYSFGIGLDKNEKGEIIVSGMWENLPAHRVGIQVGDEVIEIDGVDISNYSLLELSDIFLSSNEIKLLIENDAGKREVLLEKEDL